MEKNMKIETEPTGMEEEIGRIIEKELEALGRQDLFRKALVGFSSAKDEKYGELKKLIGEWHLSPAELLPDAESVISYFVPFTKPVFSEPKTLEGGSPLWGEAYQVINSYFEHINEAIVKYLIGMGYSAKTIPATHTYNPKDMKSMWSHRSGAAIAGLGTFGANRLLITEKGSAGRFCTVITSAPLKPGKRPEENRCLYLKNGSCGLCFRICPVHAIAPGAMEKFSCQAELFRNEEGLRKNAGLDSADICGKCISVCPLAYME